MVTNKKIKVVDDVIKVPEKKYITTDGMEFINGNAADIHQAQLDLAEKAKLCFEKYGIYTADDVLIEEDALNGNEEITKDDYLFTRVLHTDMIDIDEMYILQANDENVQREILNLFCSYLRNVKDDCFFKEASDYAFPHTIVFCRDYDSGMYIALCAEREFDLVEKAMEHGRKVLNMTK